MTHRLDDRDHEVVEVRQQVVSAIGVGGHGAKDTTHREEGAGIAELEAMTARNSQYNPGNEVPEEQRLYRFAKKHWFFGFGAYG